MENLNSFVYIIDYGFNIFLNILYGYKILKYLSITQNEI